ncbi:MAG: hypothetical protein ACOCRZ_02770 [Halothermotrichaceae bacterium]
MGTNFDFAKKFAAEKLVKIALNYIKKDPEKNFAKLINIVDKIAIADKHHQQYAVRNQFLVNTSPH